MGQILFIILLLVAGYFIYRRYRFVRRNIENGRPFKPQGSRAARWKTMMLVALGQGKMFSRPVAGVMHFFIYAGFIIINIEVLEIVIDGIAGTHRVFAFAGSFYNFLIGSFEILAILVLLACFVFLIRRNILRLRRFHQREMTSWPKTDANLILITEILLMIAFLTMNATDMLLQQHGAAHYVRAGSFPVSGFLVAPLFSSLDISTLIIIERICWWFHITGILWFIVYLSYSKHLHILLAFANTFWSKLVPPGQFDNLGNVTREVRLILDPSSQISNDAVNDNEGFGAKDIFGLSRIQLLGAYSCTECGRCTAACPANITGKLLSPRKIMMDTRDRMEEVGKKMNESGGKWIDDGKTLIHHYILPEELWACTTCNACTQACPVNIDPLSIIMDLRRYLIMEESRSPESITAMFNNTENNGAPWAIGASERLNWTNN